MSKFKIGDEVECTDGGEMGAGWELGFTFKVKTITNQRGDNPIYWEGDGMCGRGGIYQDSLKLKTTTMKKLNNFMKKLLDADTQKLIKAGLINGDLLPTTEGTDALAAILFAANKTELLAIADQMIADAEKK